MAFKRWNLCNTNKQSAREIADRCGITGFQALLLQNRGIINEDDVESFVHPEDLTFDPFSIVDMERAVNRIERAIESGEMITVYGDYDADGVTATAILYSYLQTRTETVAYYIPERNREGYGLNNDSISALCEQGTRLIVTVDNGISAHNEIDFASSLGIDTVVTDHHVPSETIPDACAVVDPHRNDCTCSFKDFAGVGVALMLICALEGADSYSFIMDAYSDLACIGTVADIVPLTGINRAIVKCGIENIRRGERVGINAILEAAGVPVQGVQSDSIAFRIAPRINALGRLGSSQNSVELLLCDDPDYARELAADMNDENERRRQIEAQLCDCIDAKFLERPELMSDRVIVVDGTDWHCGVIGIVSSRMTERFGRPCIIITNDGNSAKGSGRSVKGFSLYNALSACSEHLLGFGGHDLAAGLTLLPENIEIFRRAINDYAREHFSTMPVPELQLACKLNPSAISAELAQQIKILEPFGAGNPVPVFGIYQLQVDDVVSIGNGKHLKIYLSKNGTRLNVMYFFKTKEDFPFERGDVIDLAATLEVNEYYGRKCATVIVKDFRKFGLDQEEIISGEALYRRFDCNEALSEEERMVLLPDRDDLAAVYRFLRSNKGWNGDMTNFVARVGKDMKYPKLLVAVSVLKSKNLVSVCHNGAKIQISLCKVDGRVDIESSEVLKKLKGGIRYV